MHFEKAFPLQNKRLHPKYIKKEPWLTNGILKSTITKNEYYKTKLKTPTPENIEKYKTYNVILNKIKRIQKANYYRNLIQENSGNTKENWKI